MAIDPHTHIDSKMDENGISNRTAAGAAGYPLLRAAVGYLKTFDPEGFEEYSKIKGNGSVDGEKTEESRKAAYKYAWERAGVMMIEHYNRKFTETPKDTEGEEWKGE